MQIQHTDNVFLTILSKIITQTNNDTSGPRGRTEPFAKDSFEEITDE